ncbi:hypothetical protein Kisp01_72540 [Kineosporia sp. NBRC 101677]|nr:hypothetical protein Kisp01_72540 [Kineosporia sp. NBRC 101677]
MPKAPSAPAPDGHPSRRTGFALMHVVNATSDHAVAQSHSVRKDASTDLAPDVFRPVDLDLVGQM